MNTRYGNSSDLSFGSLSWEAARSEWRAGTEHHYREMYVNIVRGGPVQKTIKDNCKHCGRQASAEQLYRGNYLKDGRYKISLKRNLLDHCERQRRNRGKVTLKLGLSISKAYIPAKKHINEN